MASAVRDRWACACHSLVWPLEKADCGSIVNTYRYLEAFAGGNFMGRVHGLRPIGRSIYGNDVAAPSYARRVAVPSNGPLVGGFVTPRLTVTPRASPLRPVPFPLPLYCTIPSDITKFLNPFLAWVSYSYRRPGSDIVGYNAPWAARVTWPGFPAGCAALRTFDDFE